MYGLHSTGFHTEGEALRNPNPPKAIFPSKKIVATILYIYYIAENFRGRKHRKLAKNTIFVEKAFVYCSLLLRQKTPRFPNFTEKTLRIATKPRTLRKFSPSKLSHYTILYNYHHSTKLYHEFVAICIVTSAQHE